MNKKRFYRVFILMGLCLSTFSCSDNDDNKDMEKPSIDMSSSNSFPENCAILYRGESFSFQATFTDNIELGNYNVEVHNNFDHHSHSTEAEECELEPKKEAVKPWVYNQDFTIPANQTRYSVNNTIQVPSDIDTGNYHFMIRLTDKAGWQQLKSISIKVEDK